MIHILTFVLDKASAVVNDSLTNIVVDMGTKQVIDETVVNDSLTNMVEDVGTKQVIDETPSVSSGEISGMYHVFIIGTFIKMVLKSSIYMSFKELNMVVHSSVR